MTRVYYRYEAFHRTDDLTLMYLEEYPVLKETPSGVWINDWGMKKRFILTRAHKKWAHPTKAAALEGFIKRRERQIDILTAQLDRAKKALEAAKNFDPTSPKPLLLGFNLT